MRARRSPPRMAAGLLPLPLLCLFCLLCGQAPARAADPPAASTSAATTSAATTRAGPPVESWRTETERLRTLVENDAPLAYQQAQAQYDALAPTAPPAQRVRLLNLMARAEIYLAETARAGEHARTALALATQQGDRLGQAQAELNISLNSVNAGDIDALVAASTHAVALLDGIDRPELLSEALLRMAMMYHRLGKLEDSVTMTMQTMEIARRSNNPMALTLAHQGMALSFSLSDRFDDASKNYQEMARQARLAHSKMLEGYSLNGLATVASHSGDYASAEAMVRQAVALFREVGAPFGVCHTVYSLAYLQQKQGKFAEALPLYSEVVDIYVKYENIIGLWFTLNSRSAVYAALGNTKAAWADAERSYALAKKIGLPSYVSESANILAALLQARGAHQKAYAYLQEAYKLNAEATRLKANSRMLELVKRYETEARQREIDALQRRNQLQSAELQQRQLERRWLWSTLVGVITVLTVTAVLLLRLRRSHATIQNLNAGLEQRVQARTAELRQQSRYLRVLIDTLPCWVWFKDTESRYLAVNQAVAATWDHSVDGMVGLSDADIAPDRAEAFRADDLAVMSSGGPHTEEQAQMSKDGMVWVEIFKAPVQDDDGTLLGTVGFARDISERKQVEEARDLALAEAQRLARVRSDFLAQMSHELRTPLNGILGYSQILHRDASLSVGQRRAVSVIQHSGEHLLTLINDILDLAKIEAGKLGLYPSDVSLARFVESITEMIKVKTDQKGLGFSCAVATGLPAAIRIDEKRLRQILLNLLSNAVKFTDRGQVRLALGLTAGAKLRFEVHDSGVGIAADQREIIFQPFEQTGDIQRRRGGTGLGLTITRQFLHLMGSEIHVEAASDGGSIFWFELDPVPARDPIAIVVAGRRVSAYEGPRRTILVADDVPENRVLIVDMLEPLGFRMLQAADGAEAVAQAATLRPDLILMDIVMPGMDGMDATREVRTLPGLEKLPVIAMSAGATGMDRERYLAAGMDDFLPKPVDYDALLTRIGVLLELRWLEQAPAPASAAPTVHGALDALAVPPLADMTVLHQLARIGNMKDIQRWADQLAERDPRYLPFAVQLGALAASFQSKAVLRFVENYLAHEARN